MKKMVEYLLIALTVLAAVDGITDSANPGVNPTIPLFLHEINYNNQNGTIENERRGDGVGICRRHLKLRSHLGSDRVLFKTLLIVTDR